MHTASVGTVWLLLGSHRNAQAASNLCEKHLLRWEYINSFSGVDVFETDKGRWMVLAQCFHLTALPFTLTPVFGKYTDHYNTQRSELHLC